MNENDALMKVLDMHLERLQLLTDAVASLASSMRALTERVLTLEQQFEKAGRE